MGPLRELLAVDDRHALEFFAVGLRDVSEPTVDAQELLYNASVLAHYALVSTYSDTDFPAPSTLGTVFDRYVADDTLLYDGAMMEAAGAQCLLMAGFFEDQMCRRYNIRWYAHLGVAFFNRAARIERSGRRARLLETMALHFEPWRQRQCRLSRELRVQPYLLGLPTPPSLM